MFAGFLLAALLDSGANSLWVNLGEEVAFIVTESKHLCFFSVDEHLRRK